MLLCSLGFLLLSFLAAVTDFLFYRICNVFVLGILAISCLKLGLSYPHADLFFSGLVFITTLFSSYLLYSFKVLGAGDAKFLSASILFITPASYVPMYLVVMSLCGGILSILYLFFHDYLDRIRLKIIGFLKDSHISLTFLGISKETFEASFTFSDEGKKWSKILVPYGIAIFMANGVAFFYEKWWAGL